MQKKVRQVRPMSPAMVKWIVFGVVMTATLLMPGCSAPVQEHSGPAAQAPPLVDNPAPIDVNRYVQLASGSGTGRTVGVIVNPEKTGLLWQGGPDMPAIVSWEAKLADGTVITGGSSAPGIGQFNGFGEDIQGETLIVTARFSDRYEQVLLYTRV